MNLILPTYSIFLLIILNFAFFTRKRVNSDETKSYSILIVLSVFNVIFNIIGISLGYFNGVSKFLYLLNHFDLPLYFWWASIMFIYLIYVYADVCGKKELYFSLKKIIIIFNTIITILTIFLPFEIVITKTAGYAIGTCVNLVYLISGIYLLLSLIVSILLVSKKQLKKIIPLLSLIVLGIIAALIQKMVPSLIIIPSVAVMVEFIMFFTIENPDLKVVNELLRNKELVESQMEEKSDFLFEMSQGIKIPAKKIYELSKVYLTLQDDNDKKEVVLRMGENANDLIFKTNNILDVSSMDASKIKIVTGEYDVRLLFEQIKALSKNKIEDKDIKINVDIHNNVPKTLFGDDIKLKQIIMALVINAINNTDFGHIDIEVRAIVRFDVARLIIKISDTGKGMNLAKINEILGRTEDLSSEEIDNLNNLDINLRPAIKIAKLLGGNINIKSDAKSGTELTLVLDQSCKLVDTYDLRKIEKYSSIVKTKSKILIVNDDREEIFKIKNVLSSFNIDINSTMMGKDCIDRIKNNETYDLVIIDDELKDVSALTVLKTLKKQNKFKTPVVVMLEKGKEHFKNHYIDDGFKDVLLKSNLIEEINRIIKEIL